MDVDALSIIQKQINDSMSVVYSIGDGTYYEFIIRHKNNVRIVGAANAEDLYKRIPEICERKDFINCKKAFNYLWNNKNYR